MHGSQRPSLIQPQCALTCKYSCSQDQFSSTIGSSPSLSFFVLFQILTLLCLTSSVAVPASHCASHAEGRTQRKENISQSHVVRIPSVVSFLHDVETIFTHFSIQSSVLPDLVIERTLIWPKQQGKRKGSWNDSDRSLRVLFYSNIALLESIIIVYLPKPARPRLNGSLPLRGLRSSEIFLQPQTTDRVLIHILIHSAGLPLPLAEMSSPTNINKGRRKMELW